MTNINTEEASISWRVIRKLSCSGRGIYSTIGNFDGIEETVEHYFFHCLVVQALSASRILSDSVRTSFANINKPKNILLYTV